MATHTLHIDQDHLVVRLQARDVIAFDYLYDHYASAIYGIILRIVIDEKVADEVLQDAFMKFWNKIHQYDASKGRLFTWMINISRNLAIDRWRSKEIKKAGKTDRIENYVTDIEGELFVQQKVDVIGLKDAMMNLRTEEKFILEMVYFKGYTQSEISEEFDIPLGTVKTRLRMALNNMRKVLRIK